MDKTKTSHPLYRDLSDLKKKFDNMDIKRAMLNLGDVTYPIKKHLLETMNKTKNYIDEVSKNNRPPKKNQAPLPLAPPVTPVKI